MTGESAVEFTRDPYRLRLRIPWLPPMNTAATRRHRMVQAREASELKALVCAMVGRRRPHAAPLFRARATCTRHSASEPDFENLALCFKAPIDALVHHRVLRGDFPRALERVYAWEKAGRGHGFLSILIEQLPE